MLILNLDREGSQKPLYSPLCNNLLPPTLNPLPRTPNLPFSRSIFNRQSSSWPITVPQKFPSLTWPFPPTLLFFCSLWDVKTLNEALETLIRLDLAEWEGLRPARCLLVLCLPVSNQSRLDASDFALSSCFNSPYACIPCDLNYPSHYGPHGESLEETEARRIR